ncbi:Flap endonuclease GEN 1 [Mycena kentingensis (nom. inval.)]|nr:Flap endonuclease GEN 1 [Mycena kentingensis (nom. inval.)]
MMLLRFLFNHHHHHNSALPPPPPFDNIPLAPAFEPLFDAAPALFDLDLDWDAELPRLDSLPPTAGNNLVPASAPAPPTPTFPTSVLNSFDSGADPDQHLREAEWARLVAKFPEARLRAHRWEWLTAGPKANTLLPYYDYAPVTKICEIWEEYHSGLNGCLPTRQLESEWKASWRRNNRSLKNAYSLRNRVVTLVEQLAAERKWTTDRVLRFLREEYDEASPPVYTTVRSFCEGLDTSSAKLRGKTPTRADVRALAQLLGFLAQTTTLGQLATERGFQTDNRGVRSWIVGVDMGTRLSSLQKLSFRNWRSSEKHILELFFYQLCNLQRSSATFIFVFDGPGRPKVKRGVRVWKHSRNLLKNVKQLIKAFGYYVHDAPGEAEAELAYLNKKGNIDAIITTDSDVFVFGLKSTSKCRCLTRHAATAPLSLDRGGFLLVALMAGGDYDEGTPGCSAQIAYQLAQLGFGTRLLQILANYHGDARKQRLDTWRKCINFELETNPSGRLDRAHPSVARQLTRSFPQSSIIDLYLNPATSESADLPLPLWIPVQPDLAKISRLATSLLGWKGSAKDEKLHRVLWPGVAFRLISSCYVLYDSIHQRLVTPSCATTLVKLQRKRGSKTELTIRTSVDDFCMQTDVVASEPSVLLHIPEAVLAVATRDVASIATNFTIRPDVVQAIRNTTNSSHLPTVVVRSSVRADILLDRDEIEVEDTDDEDFLSAHRRLGLQGVVDLSGLE